MSLSGGRTLIVSRGIGMERGAAPRFRFRCHPEIVVVEPTGSETQVFAKLGGEEIVAVFRERHQFKPGEKIRLKPDPTLVHLFDDATGKRLTA